MATDPQIKFINDLAKYAPARVEQAKLTWGDELWDMPVLEAKLLLMDLVDIRDSFISQNQKDI